MIFTLSTLLLCATFARGQEDNGMPTAWAMSGDGRQIVGGSADVRLNLDVDRDFLLQHNATIGVLAGSLLRFLNQVEMQPNSVIDVLQGLLGIRSGLILPAGEARINGSVQIDNSTMVTVGAGATLHLGGEGFLAGRIHLMQNATVMLEGRHEIRDMASFTGRGRVILAKSAWLNITDGVQLRIEPDLLVYGGAHVNVEAESNLVVFNGRCMASSDDDITTNGLFADAGFALMTQSVMTVLHNFYLDGHYCSFARGDGSGLLFLAPVKAASLYNQDIAAAVAIAGAGNVTLLGENLVHGDLQVEPAAKLNVTGPLTVNNLAVLGGAGLIFDTENWQVPAFINARAARFMAGSKLMLMLHNDWTDESVLNINDQFVFNGELIVLRRTTIDLERSYRFAAYANFSGAAARVFEWNAPAAPAGEWFAQFNETDAWIVWRAAEPITTTQLPATTTQLPATTTQLPATTTQLPATTTQLPATTQVVVVPNVTLIIPTEQEPSTTTQLPLTTTELPLTTTELPLTTTELPLTTTELPATTTTQLAATTIISQVPRDDTDRTIRIGFNFTAIAKVDAEDVASANKNVAVGVAVAVLALIAAM